MLFTPAQRFFIGILLALAAAGCMVPGTAPPVMAPPVATTLDAPPPAPTATETPDSAATQTAVAADRCLAHAGRALSVTVRLRVELFRSTVNGYGLERVDTSHGTLEDGRYIVTHGHYGNLVGTPGDGYDRYLTVTRADGTTILKRLPVHALELVVVGTQLWVIDLGTLQEIPLLDMLSYPTLPATHISAASLQPGMMVGQINWNGERAHVDCVTVRSVGQEDGVTIARLENKVSVGASGGGIFLGDKLVGNNWKVVTASDVSSGHVVDEYTVAALFTPSQAATLARLGNWLQ